MFTVSTPLLSSGEWTAAQIDAAFAHYGNDPAGLGDAIVFWGSTGLNTDILAMQIADETAWWTSDDALKRNNPSGFGHTDDAPEGMAFASVQDGVHATVAHWFTYLKGDDNLMKDADPRFDAVPPEHRGMTDLTVGETGNGVWATAPDYPEALLNRQREMLDFLSINPHNGGSEGANNVRIILSIGHENIQNITDEMLGSGEGARLSHDTGSLGTEATANRAVVEAAAANLRGIADVVITDAIYHTDVYGTDADLCVFVHHDGVTFGNDHPQKSGVSVVQSGHNTQTAFDTAQKFSDAWKRISPQVTGIEDTSTLTNDMTFYYGGWYPTENTPKVLVECSVWGGSDGQRPDVDTDKEGYALAMAVKEALGLGQTDGSADGSTATGGGDQQSDGGVTRVAIAGGTIEYVTLTGDDRGCIVTLPGGNASTGQYGVGHGFLDRWTEGNPRGGNTEAVLNAAVARDGWPLSGEFGMQYMGKTYTVQVFERAVYTWDGETVDALDLGRLFLHNNIAAMPGNVWR